MSSKFKTSLIIAAAIAVIGLVLALIAFLFGGMQPLTISKDGIKLANNDTIAFDNTYSNITSIDADLDFRDIIIKEGPQFRVQSKGVGTGFKAEDVNGTLTIKDNGKSSWFHFDIFNFTNEGTEHSDLIITCPKKEMAQVKINTDSGNIKASDINAKNLTLITDFGDIDIVGVIAGKANLDLDSGNLDIEDTNIDTIKFDLEFGDVDAKSLIARSVKGDLSSGSVDMRGRIVGPIDMDLEFGDIDLTLNGKEDQYSYELETEFGDIDLNGHETEGSIIKEYENKPKIKLNLSSGSASIKFI